ncbi:MAG TPA: hypothetical protein VJM08_09775 [Anaerolineales bacterium]|nr:hypothetical protein [Anaerolineales bacterium]
MIPNKEKLRERFLRDPLPRRLGGLAATLGRISSIARETSDPANVSRLLHEARYFIEWTAAETEPEVAAELVSMQRLITLWLKAWDKASQNKEERTLLSVQAKYWSDRALAFSGLVNV